MIFLIDQVSHSFDLGVTHWTQLIKDCTVSWLHWIIPLIQESSLMLKVLILQIITIYLTMNFLLWPLLTRKYLLHLTKLLHCVQEGCYFLPPLIRFPFFEILSKGRNGLERLTNSFTLHFGHSWNQFYCNVSELSDKERQRKDRKFFLLSLFPENFGSLSSHFVTEVCGSHKSLHHPLPFSPCILPPRSRDSRWRTMKNFLGDK